MQLTEYDISNPFTATVTKSERITDENTDEVRHINLRVSHPSFQFIEGQSVGVLVPAPPIFGNENYMRLYSMVKNFVNEFFVCLEALPFKRKNLARVSCTPYL